MHEEYISVLWPWVGEKIPYSFQAGEDNIFLIPRLLLQSVISKIQNRHAPLLVYKVCYR
jgi:hypothetical protein